MAFNFTRAAFLDARSGRPVRHHREQPRQRALLAAAPAADRDPPRRHVARLPDPRHHPRPLGHRRLRGEHRTLAGDLRRPGDRARAEGGARHACASAGASSTRFRPTCASSPTPKCDACRRRRARSSARRRCAGRRRLTLSALGVSDFARFDRAEGLRLRRRRSRRASAAASALELRGRYGIDDEQGKGSGALAWRSPRWGVRLFGQRDFRDAGDVQERSRLINSIAAQEFGSDDTDPYGVQAVGLGLEAVGVKGFDFQLDGSLERQRPLAVRATPATRTLRADPPGHATARAAPLAHRRASHRTERPRHRAALATASCGRPASPPTMPRSRCRRAPSAGRSRRSPSSGRSSRGGLVLVTAGGAVGANGADSARRSGSTSAAR